MYIYIYMYIYMYIYKHATMISSFGGVSFLRSPLLGWSPERLDRGTRDPKWSPKWPMKKAKSAPK